MYSIVGIFLAKVSVVRRFILFNGSDSWRRRETRAELRVYRMFFSVEDRA